MHWWLHLKFLCCLPFRSQGVCVMCDWRPGWPLPQDNGALHHGRWGIPVFHVWPTTLHIRKDWIWGCLCIGTASSIEGKELHDALNSYYVCILPNNLQPLTMAMSIIFIIILLVLHFFMICSVFPPCDMSLATCSVLLVKGILCAISVPVKVVKGFLCTISVNYPPTNITISWW